MHTTPYGKVKKTSAREKMLEKIIDKYNFSCLNEKKETYYQAYNHCKSIIDLTLAKMLIAQKIIWSNEYNLRDSDHFVTLC